MHENWKNICVGTVYNGEALLVFLKKSHPTVGGGERLQKQELFSCNLMFTALRKRNAHKWPKVLVDTKIGGVSFWEMKMFCNIFRKTIMKYF